jgi:hypothetical protein
VFHSPQPGHRPDQARAAWPQLWHVNLGSARDIARS